MTLNCNEVPDPVNLELVGRSSLLRTPPGLVIGTTTDANGNLQLFVNVPPNYIGDGQLGGATPHANQYASSELGARQSVPDG
jgi:hypothetical protein